MNEHELRAIIFQLLKFIGVKQLQHYDPRYQREWICEFVQCGDTQCHECMYKDLQDKIYEEVTKND